MPPRVKVTKDMIVRAALDIIREEGHDKVSVRSIAEKLGCSTQPVLYSYGTMDEIWEDVYKGADAFHTDYMIPRVGDETDPVMSLWLNYIMFAKEEPRLFRFLYQTDRFSAEALKKMTESPDAVTLIKMASAPYDFSADAEELFLTILSFVHGYASLLANGSVEYDEMQIKKMLVRLHTGLFEPKAGRDVSV